MSDRTEKSNVFGVTNPNAGNINGTLENDNLVSIARMKAKLQDEDEGYYTDARIQNMSYNDLVYAVRYGTAEPETVPTGD